MNSFDLATFKTRIIAYIHQTSKKYPVNIIAVYSDSRSILTWNHAFTKGLCRKGVAGFTIEARPEAHDSNTRTPTNPGSSTNPPICTHPEAPTLTSSSKKRHAEVPLPPKDFTICQFLAVCNITPDSKEYNEILQVITKHQVIHWTAFEDLPLRNFINLGFKWGPAWLLLRLISFSRNYLSIPLAQKKLLSISP
ncbi:hypothetical protein PTTG_11115 [Puccinia triticina 1-1 BBBD Race 1]|uniref:Uncharacterized protein n=1 Tax=Puccinia triticina (isolate 1-1 / race 1 (BBBD)) TaxID=630390 RepID=A0A180GBJ3_PUCT1|nr:hypothetical protein PTTG_11115 [Puccinia triticina 1-1 BBBD Race 1]